MRHRPESTTNIIQTAEAKAQLAMFAASCPDRCAALTVQEILARFRVPRKFAAGVLLEAQLRASL